MSTDEGTAVGPERRTSPPTPAAGSTSGSAGRSAGRSARRPAKGSTSASRGTPSLAVRRPSWWSREHPVFVPLASFFAGMALVLFTFGLLGAIVSQVLGYDAAGTVFPYSFVIFVVPLVLIGFAHTRRVGLYLLLGMVLTAVVVIGVAAATLALLLAGDG